MTYKIEDIINEINKNEESFIAKCEARYEDEINKAAEAIIDHRGSSKIVLLAGPSASGKTTTSMKITDALKARGYEAKTISLDNYFRTVDETMPTNEKGEPDFESPLCIDYALLYEHFDMIEKGLTINVPVFDFEKQARSGDEHIVTEISENTFVIFEGIHALNDLIMGQYPGAFGIYICVLSQVDFGNDMFTSGLIRLCRRGVRDMKFRGADVAFTLKIWENVMEGERKYIAPFRDRAMLEIDSFLPYELSVLKKYVLETFGSAAGETKYDDEKLKILQMISKLPDISDEKVSHRSLLREFIGGSAYSY